MYMYMYIVMYIHVCAYGRILSRYSPPLCILCEDTEVVPYVHVCIYACMYMYQVCLIHLQCAPRHYITCTRRLHYTCGMCFLVGRALHEYGFHIHYRVVKLADSIHSALWLKCTFARNSSSPLCVQHSQHQSNDGACVPWTHLRYVADTIFHLPKRKV